MACSKYTLTNTGSTIVNFNYQRCDDAKWEYQVELAPNQTKNIWLLNSTYSTAFPTNIVELDLGTFPPLKVTPTPTQTPTNTSTPTPTPSFTPTQTQTVTPSEPIRYTQSVSCHDENSAQGACNCDQGATVFTNGVDFSSSTLAFSDPTGLNTGDPDGFYIQNDVIYQVALGCGIGCGTGSAITVVGSCGPTPTPTPSSTQILTPTPTQSGTPAVTPTPTPSSFGSNKFKVTMLGSARAILNSFTLNESPYIGSSGVGFSATTGTYPLVAGPATVYGTHASLSTSTVSFGINSSGSSSIQILWYLNGSVNIFNSSVVSGANTVNLYVAGPVSTSDTLEFRIG